MPPDGEAMEVASPVPAHTTLPEPLPPAAPPAPQPALPNARQPLSAWLGTLSASSISGGHQAQLAGPVAGAPAVSLVGVSPDDAQGGVDSAASARPPMESPNRESPDGRWRWPAAQGILAGAALLGLAAVVVGGWLGPSGSLWWCPCCQRSTELMEPQLRRRVRKGAVPVPLDDPDETVDGEAEDGVEDTLPPGAPEETRLVLSERRVAVA